MRKQTRPAGLLTFRRAALCLAAAATLLCAAPATLAQALQPGGPTDFGPLPLGGSMQMTLTFTASVVTNISSVTATTAGASGLDFTVASQDCTGTQRPPASCSITLQFAPTMLGLRKGALSITDGSGAVVNRVFLHGIGTGPQLSFAPQTSTTYSAASASAALDGNGNLFYNDIASGTLFERTAAGAVSVIANIPASPLSSLAIAGTGTLYISAPSQGLIYALIPGGTPTVVPTPGVTLLSPSGLVVDGLGFLYAADSTANAIYRIALDGSGATALSLNGLTLARPTGLALDAAYNLYIVDSANDRIAKLGLFTGATSLAPVSGLTLLNPTGIAVDAASTLYIADTGNHRVVVAPPSLPAYILATPAATVTAPSGVVAAGNGDLFVADLAAGAIALLRSSLNINFPTPTRVGTFDSADGILGFSVQNTGTENLNLARPTTGTNPGISTHAFIATIPGNTCPLISAASPSSTPSSIPLGLTCQYVAEFSPTNTGLNSAGFIISVIDAAGPSTATPATMTVGLSGTGTSDVTRFTLTASPSITGVAQPVSFTLTALAGSTPSQTYLGTVTFTSTDPTAQFLSGSTYTFTAADNGVHTFPAPGGIKFNQTGVFTLSAADNALNGTSNPITVLAAPTVALTSSVNPIFIQNTTILTATVAFLGGTPTGSVTFYDGATALGSAVTLGTGGIATLSITFSTTGQHTLTAVYSGDPTYIQTTSPAVLETVGDFTLATAAGSPTTINTTRGNPAVFTLQFTPVGLAATPSNTTFSVSGLPTGVTAVFSPASLPSQSTTRTVTLTLTPAVTGSTHRSLAGSSGPRLALILLSLLAIPFTILRRRRFKSLASLAMLLFLAAAATGLTGCLSDASSGYYDFKPYTGSVIITATSGELSHTTTVTLNVTQ